MRGLALLDGCRVAHRSRFGGTGVGSGLGVRIGARWLRETGVRITRIATGVPAGSDIEYADEVTMARALEGRRDV